MARSGADRDFAERLVTEVQKRPKLYDASDPDYKDRGKIELEWADVAAVMDATVDFVRKKWQTLRGSYSRSIVAQSMACSPAAKKPARFYLEAQMSFLKSHMANTSVLGTYGAIKPESAPEEVEEADVNLCHGGEEAQEEPLRTIRTPRKRRKVPGGNDAIEGALLNFLERRDKRKESDGDLEFLKGLLPQIKELSKTRKRRYFKHISNLLFEALEEQEQEEGGESSALAPAQFCK